MVATQGRYLLHDDEGIAVGLYVLAIKNECRIRNKKYRISKSEKRNPKNEYRKTNIEKRISKNEYRKTNNE